jgi:ABC-type oligopeptide transport system substrate-binding subunit
MISRRAVVTGGPMALGACARAGEKYFGDTRPPRGQRLVTTLDNEPPSLDPALSSGLIDSLILAMFEGLISLHPVTGAPMAGLCTHYESTPDGLRYTFYLRGHPQPRGTRLPNADNLTAEFSRGLPAAPDSLPARWSDGVPVTAYDFVYSWRRASDPATAADLAYLFYPIRNAQSISAGKLAPDLLGIRALDDYALEAILEYPAPYFLELVSGRVFAAVPRHVVEQAGERWTDPDNIVCSGAFKLHSHRPYDSIVLRRNSRSYDAARVALDELVILITRDLTTLVNQYRAGVAMLAYPAVPSIMPLLRRKKDFLSRRVYASAFFNVNTKTPPFDDVRLRYALNMATDKRPVVDLFGAGWIPASGLIPASANYQSPRSLPVVIDGRVYDVLSFDLLAARALLSKIPGPIPSRLQYVVPNSPDDMLWAQVLKEQWRKNLGIEIEIRAVDFQIWIDTFRQGTFPHLADAGSSGGYVDPTWFLDLFNRPDGYGTHWGDPLYRTMLAEAKATPDPSLRLARLAECERRLLRAMPVLPLAQWVDAVLKKPFVKGIGNNLLDRQQFKYAWIDQHWRPQ